MQILASAGQSIDDPTPFHTLLSAWHNQHRRDITTVFGSNDALILDLCNQQSMTSATTLDMYIGVLQQFLEGKKLPLLMCQSGEIEHAMKIGRKRCKLPVVLQHGFIVAAPCYSSAHWPRLLDADSRENRDRCDRRRSRLFQHGTV